MYISGDDGNIVYFDWGGGYVVIIKTQWNWFFKKTWKSTTIIPILPDKTTEVKIPMLLSA